MVGNGLDCQPTSSACLYVAIDLIFCADASPASSSDPPADSCLGGWSRWESKAEFARDRDQVTYFYLTFGAKIYP